MHLVGYSYEDYHDARSLEHKVVSKHSGPQNAALAAFVSCLCAGAHFPQIVRYVLKSPANCLFVAVVLNVSLANV
jgi:hypothetical protein